MFTKSEAWQKWRDVAKQLKEFKGPVTSFLKRIPAKDRDYCIFAGAAFSEINGDEYLDFRTLLSDRISPKRFIDLYVEWVICYASDLHSDYHYWNEQFPGPHHLYFEGELYTEVLLAVIERAPDDSNAYTSAAVLFFEQNLTSSAINKFRTLWSSLKHERREAISIALHPKPWELTRGIPKTTIYVVQNMTSKLEAIVGSSDASIRTLNRSRWIDTHFPLLRGEIWETMVLAIKDFSKEVDRMGGEREQVGSLLQCLMNAFRNSGSDRSAAWKSMAGEKGRMKLDRYVFNSSEENLCGPDFALVFLFEEHRKISLARYVLFQAKLIKDAVIRVPLKQLTDMLRSSFHGSFYIVWGPENSPRCLPAPLLRSLISYDQMDRRSVSSPTLRWSNLRSYSDSLADLLADRFLCGELGDPLDIDSDFRQPDVAHRLGELFGPFRHGVVIFSASVGRDLDVEQGGFQVGAKDISIGKGE